MSSRSLPRARFRLRTKLALLASAVAVIPLVIVGLALVEVNASAVETGSRELQIAMLSDVAATVERELEQAEEALDSVGRALTDTEHTESTRIHSAQRLVESSRVLDHVAIHDGEGHVIDVIREESARAPEHGDLTAPMLAEATEQGVVVGEAAATEEGPRVLVVVPIRASGDVTGFAASWMSMARIQKRIELLARSHVGAGGDALFLVDERMRVLAHADPVRAIDRVDASGLEILDGIERMQPGLSRSGEFHDADGQPVVGTVSALPGRRWAVATQVPTELAYASLVRMRRIVLLMIVAAVLVALVAGVGMARRITRPLDELTRFAGALADRKFDTTVTVRTNDELGVLAAAMGNAAGDLAESEARILEEVAIRRDLGRYVPAELVDKIVRREADMALGGERREITVMFADVVGFTPLTEQLSAEAVVQILNELFSITTEIIFRHGGTVDKFVGDCVMAMWGAPTPSEDHARRALMAAEEILSWLEVGNANWKRKHGVTIQLAIGVNTGDAVVGNIGSSTRMEYTAIGDAVNVAARLETIARPQQILVSRETRDAAGSDFEYADVGEKVVAGRTKTVHLYEVVT